MAIVEKMSFSWIIRFFEFEVIHIVPLDADSYGMIELLASSVAYASLFVNYLWVYVEEKAYRLPQADSSPSVHIPF